VEMDGDGSTDTVAEVSLLEPGDVIFEWWGSDQW
jgi:hypothetical protein